MTRPDILTAEAHEVEYAPIPRDRMSRPLIIPPGGGKPTAYTRCSTFAKALSDGDSLSQWKRRTMVKGMAAAGAGQIIGWLDSIRYEQGNPDVFIEELHDLGGGNDGAKWGTALHGLAEFVDADGWVPEQGTIPNDLWSGLQRYIQLTEGIEMLSCEGFVVLDDIKVAGSYDRIGIMPDGGLCVLDIKTGPRIHQNVSEVEVQLACYARGIHYAPDGTRDIGPLEGVSQSVGYVIQISRDGSGDRLIEIDLERGWANAQLALQVRKQRTAKPKCIIKSL